jgi:transposase
VAVSAGAIESEIQEAVDSESIGFRGGWISSHMLDRLLRERGVKVSRSRIGSILTELGYSQWGRAPRPIMMEDAKRPVLWYKGTPAQGYTESQRPGYM